MIKFEIVVNDGLRVNIETKLQRDPFLILFKCLCINHQILFSVNNVGINYSYPMYVGEVPEKDLWDIINVNVGAATMMTRLIINDMKKRGRGAIVNVSSGSELQPLPLMTVYAATKVNMTKENSKEVIFK